MRLHYFFRIAISGVLVAAWLLLLSLAAYAETVDFAQIDFDLNGTTTVNSDWGVADVTYTGSEDIVYFNLAVNGSWQVQNVPVLSEDGVGESQSERFWFDLGNTSGTDVTALNYDSELTTSPLLSAPSGSTAATVADEDVIIYSGGSDVTMNTIPAAAAAYVGGAAAEAVKHVNEDFPNQEAGKKECAPVAVSNSLRWLNRKHKMGIPEGELTIAKMKEATNWNGPAKGGAWIWPNPARPAGEKRAWYQDKAEYMLAKNFRISTVVFTPASIDQVIKEIDANEDVEIELNGHTAAVVSITKLVNGKYKVTIKHDDKQGVDGGTVKESGTWDGTAWEWDRGAMNAKKFGLNYFVVESPIKPLPGTGRNNYWLFLAGSLSLVAGLVLILKVRT